MSMHHPALSITLAAVAMLVLGAPLMASESDDRIVSTFEKSYVSKTYLVDDAITIRSKDGVVTLSGTVLDESHLSLARETAAGLPGVIRVDNQLVTKGDVPANRSDVWIANRARMTLLFHRNVSASKTSVEVKDGIVTISGEAGSVAQKELTIEYVKDIDGVRDVKDSMTVKAAPDAVVRTIDEQVDDASISAQVKTALMTHRSTSAVKTTVETRKGEVTLTGIARNDAEKALVTKLTTDILGVSAVKNKMTVDEAGAR